MAARVGGSRLFLEKTDVRGLQHLSSCFAETATISAWFATGSVLELIEQVKYRFRTVFMEISYAFVDLVCTTGSELQYSGD